jgi:hypothetical protein
MRFSVILTISMLYSVVSYALSPGVINDPTHDPNVIHSITGAGIDAQARITGAPSDGVSIVPGSVRLFIYTGANPSPSGGSILWYEDAQIPDRAPICVATLSVPEPGYAGTYPVGNWSNGTTLQFSYWRETAAPTLILTWSGQLLPYHAYSIDTYCVPKLQRSVLPTHLGNTAIRQ